MAISSSLIRPIPLTTAQRIAMTLPEGAMVWDIDLNMMFAHDGSGWQCLTESLVTGCRAFWTLDEASGTRADETGNGHTLTDNNTVTSATGKVGNAASFAAANSERLTEAHTASLQFGDQSWTVSAWVKLATKTAIRPIYTRDNNVAGEREFVLNYDNGADRFLIYVFKTVGNDQLNADVLGSPSLATWYHILTWRDNVRSTLNIRVNLGTPNSMASTGAGASATLTTEIGGWAGNAAYMDGQIDAVGFWARTLTEAEMVTLYAAGRGSQFPFRS